MPLLADIPSLDVPATLRTLRRTSTAKALT